MVRRFEFREFCVSIFVVVPQWSKHNRWHNDKTRVCLQKRKKEKDPTLARV
jgi:hypothetical protein